MHGGGPRRRDVFAVSADKDRLPISPKLFVVCSLARRPHSALKSVTRIAYKHTSVIIPVLLDLSIARAKAHQLAIFRDSVSLYLGLCDVRCPETVIYIHEG